MTSNPVFFLEIYYKLNNEMKKHVVQGTIKKMPCRSLAFLRLSSRIGHFQHEIGSQEKKVYHKWNLDR